MLVASTHEVAAASVGTGEVVCLLVSQDWNLSQYSAPPAFPFWSWKHREEIEVVGVRIICFFGIGFA